MCADPAFWGAVCEPVHKQGAGARWPQELTPYRGYGQALVRGQSPKPQTLNLNLESWPSAHQRSIQKAISPKPQTLNPKSQTLNPNPLQVNEIFDEISYCKGAAVIMMITSYLGMELFQKGIRAYLAKHKYNP